MESNIKSIADLVNRIINGTDYESLWHDRCRNMQILTSKNHRLMKDDKSYYKLWYPYKLKDVLGEFVIKKE